jgi:hypothetical protein
MQSLTCWLTLEFHGFVKDVLVLLDRPKSRLHICLACRGVKETSEAFSLGLRIYFEAVLKHLATIKRRPHPLKILSLFFTLFKALFINLT